MTGIIGLVVVVIILVLIYFNFDAIKARSNLNSINKSLDKAKDVVADAQKKTETVASLTMTDDDEKLGAIWSRRLEDGIVNMLKFETDKSHKLEPGLHLIELLPDTKYVEVLAGTKFTNFTMTGMRMVSEQLNVEFTVKITGMADNTVEVEIGNTKQKIKHCRKIAILRKTPTQIHLVFDQLIDFPLSIRGLEQVLVENTTLVKYLESAKAAKHQGESSQGGN
jgi:hypothetical protein